LRLSLAYSAVKVFLFCIAANAQQSQEGVKIDAKRMDESYGRFAWIYDLDGNKIELWQPLPAKP